MDDDGHLLPTVVKLSPVIRVLFTAAAYADLPPSEANLT